MMKLILFIDFMLLSIIIISYFDIRKKLIDFRKKKDESQAH
jgi:hypothetical protein